MIGIIYKLTIRAKIKFDGHKPFYVGQHWCKSTEDFLCRSYPYYGSGSIWNDLLSGLKRKNPNNWQYFVKREVLCTITNNSQKTLDKLEEFWIKREKAHYSYGLGGCNILWGTSNEFGSGSPAKDPNVRKKMSRSMQKRLKRGWKPAKHFYTQEQRQRQSEIMKQKYINREMIAPLKGKKLSKERLDKMLIGYHEFLIRVNKTSAMQGKHHTEECKRELSKKIKEQYKNGRKVNFKGEHHTEEVRKILSKKTKLQFQTSGNPMRGRVRITNGIVNTTILRGEELPSGFWYGMKKRKKN